ncbi:MAG: hypothetical protein G01um10143_640 [Parcubacteria group bacterium Gr01-1014_3]|nr:MAG: hypothetical protein G01um10143_640 [Parcubacteria group bacterium Gr01-1014_3]
MNRPVITKIISLGGVVAFFALIFSYAAGNLLSIGSFSSAFWTFIASVLFLSAFVIQVLLVDNFLISAGMIVAQVAAMTIFLGGSLSLVMFAAILIAIALLISAYYNGRLEVKNNLEIRFFKTGQVILRGASSAIAIFVIVAFISILDFEDPAAAKQHIGIAIRPLEPIASAYIPKFSIENSLTDISLKLLPKEADSIAPGARQLIVQEAAQRVAEVIGNFTGLKIRPADTITDILYDLTLGRLSNLPPILRTVFLVFGGFLIFLLIKFLLIFVNWLALGLGWLLYQALFNLGFFKIQTQSVEKYVISL